jgi:uncharacterized protein (DUF1697 family)
MPRYVAFFSSINVGPNRVAMADLRHAFEREDFEDVETVVASGNVLFAHDERPSEGLEDKLAHLMRERFDIDSFAAVRSAAEVAEAIEGNPFVADGEENRVHTQFLDGEATRDAFDKLVDAYAGRGRERMALGPRSLYIDFVDGVAGSKLTGDFIARRLARRGTARNIRSLRRILAKMV